MTNSIAENKKTLVQASFDRWREGTGSPFELLAPEVDWTIVGPSPLSFDTRDFDEFWSRVSPKS
jgi:hypothetical protein